MRKHHVWGLFLSGISFFVIIGCGQKKPAEAPVSASQSVNPTTGEAPRGVPAAGSFTGPDTTGSGAQYKERMRQNPNAKPYGGSTK